MRNNYTIITKVDDSIINRTNNISFIKVDIPEFNPEIVNKLILLAILIVVILLLIVLICTMNLMENLDFDGQTI